MHLWQYNNEIIISQFCDTSGDTNKQLIDGQKIIDIRPHTRYNVSNLIRKQCYHYGYAVVGMVAIYMNPLERNG